MDFNIEHDAYIGRNKEGKRIVEYFRRGNDNVVICKDSDDVYSILENYDFRNGECEREHSFSDSIEKCRKRLTNANETIEYTQEVKEMGKQINENLTDSPYKEIIGNYFDHTFNFEFLDIVANVIDRIDDYRSEEDAYEAIDAELIYSDDQWTVMQFYQTPEQANFNDAMDSFTSDILAICELIVTSIIYSD